MGMCHIDSIVWLPACTILLLFRKQGVIFRSLPGNYMCIIIWKTNIVVLRSRTATAGICVTVGGRTGGWGRISNG